ncbi:MAG: thioredoxin reductase [Parcubacteria group bacterium Athens0714_26]|nr:MAG: thioredoxin reductase [Parcubacteria group bacterium Athens0714_26]
MIYDVAIIGGSFAGLTAGIYSARKKLSTIILTKNLGGQAILTEEIGNFPGFEKISGRELTQKITDQNKKYGVEIKEGTEIISIKKDEEEFEVRLRNLEVGLRAKSVIIATGKEYRHLNVPGGKEYENKGISFCSTCDAPLFENKDVAVVGGGNSGLCSSRDLLAYANKIYVMDVLSQITGDEIIQEQLKKSGKVEFITNAKIKEIKGGNFVEKIIYSDGDDEKELNVQGIFVNIGWMPSSGLAKELVKINKAGEIIIDHNTNETSVPGIFAAGDVTDIKYKQCVIAAAEGAKAALSAYEYLKNKK